MCMCVRACLCVCVFPFVHVYMCVSMCMCICVRVCVGMCVCVCLRLCMCMCVSGILCQTDVCYTLVHPSSWWSRSLRWSQLDGVGNHILTRKQVQKINAATNRQLREIHQMSHKQPQKDFNLSKIENNCRMKCCTFLRHLDPPSPPPSWRFYMLSVPFMCRKIALISFLRGFSWINTSVHRSCLGERCRKQPRGLSRN